MPGPITLRNIGSSVNVGGISRALANANNSLNSSFSGLQNAFQGISNQRDSDAEKSFRDSLVGLSADDLASFDVANTAQAERLGASALQNILGNKLNSARANESAEYTRQQQEIQKAQSPILAQFNQGLINAENTEAGKIGFTKDFIEQYSDNPNMTEELKAKLAGLGQSSGEGAYNRRRTRKGHDERDKLNARQNAELDRKEAERKAIENAQKYGSNYIRGLSEFGTNNYDPEVKRNVLSGIANNLAKQNNVTGDFSIGPDGSPVFVSNSVSGGDNINKVNEALRKANTDLFGKDTYTPVDEDQELYNYTQSDAFLNAPVGMQPALRDNFKRQLDNKYSLQGQYKKKYDTEVSMFNRSQEIEGNKLQAQYDTALAATKKQLPLDNPNNIQSTTKWMVDFVHENSDNKTDTNNFNSNLVGGNEAIEYLSGIMSGGFIPTGKGKGDKIPTSELTDAMIKTAMMQNWEHDSESGYSFSDPALNKKGFIRTLSSFANNREAFEKTNNQNLINAQNAQETFSLNSRAAREAYEREARENNKREQAKARNGRANLLNSVSNR